MEVLREIRTGSLAFSDGIAGYACHQGWMQQATAQSDLGEGSQGQAHLFTSSKELMVFPVQ